MDSSFRWPWVRFKIFPFNEIYLMILKWLSKWRRRDKMTTSLQTTFSSTFLCVEIVVFWFEFHWNGPINNMPTLVQMMATSHYLNLWCHSLLTHICVTRPVDDQKEEECAKLDQKLVQEDTWISERGHFYLRLPYIQWCLFLSPLMRQ